MSRRGALRDGQTGLLVNITKSGRGGFDIEVADIPVPMLTNHLGSMLFTLTLLPLLNKTALASEEEAGPNDVRIVNVNSTAHIDAPESSRSSTLADFYQIFPHDENGEDYARYAHTKLANALFSLELQRRLIVQHIPIIVTFPHPGAVATVDASKFFWVDPDEIVLKNRTLHPLEGALTLLFCAVHPQVREQEWNWKGKFVIPYGGIKVGSLRLKDTKLWTECWSGSMAVIEGALMQR
jgi:NAD(P)-dependent dehydrogenase (short-subunit alcohol dehydrogenase family)